MLEKENKLGTSANTAKFGNRGQTYGMFLWPPRITLGSDVLLLIQYKFVSICF